MKRYAFTMIELIFVIVVMGILAKYGVEFLAQSYNNFIFSNINHTLQSSSESAVEIISKRLQYRIKASVIGRNDNNFSDFESVGNTAADKYSILEWVGFDAEGFRGTTEPLWSGIIDLDPSTSTALLSPETNTTALNALIQILSNNTAAINDAALYFVGSNSNVKTGYGWDGNAITTQSATMHPIHRDANASVINKFIPVKGDINGTNNSFSGVDVYEYYQLAWTAYAVGFDDYNTTTHTGTLRLWYNYQPWQGEKYTDGNSTILLENASTFRFKSIGSILQIQVCAKSTLVKDENYSICKEKTVF